VGDLFGVFHGFRQFSEQGGKKRNLKKPNKNGPET
jgi:hypothetical protein